MRTFFVLLTVVFLAACASPLLRGTGDLGLFVERASGRLTLVDSSKRAPYARIEGLGVLSHASAVYSRNGRYAYNFGRAGGLHPYNGLVTPDGRHYLAGLFGEEGVSLLDTWQSEQGARKILETYGRGQEKLPVFKMPHLRGWSVAQGKAYLPASRRREVLVLVLVTDNGRELGRIKVKGQPVSVMARPDGRQIWVNYAFPDDSWVEVIDTLSGKIIKTLEPGKAILHMEFTPRGEHV